MMEAMKEPQTASDLWPLVQKLSPDERISLARLALASVASVDGYNRQPVSASEFSSDLDSLAWEADGWDELDAAR